MKESVSTINNKKRIKHDEEIFLYDRFNYIVRTNY